MKKLNIGLLTLLTVVLVSCPITGTGTPPDGSLGPYPVIGISSNRFVQVTLLPQSETLTIPPANPAYTDILSYHETDLPTYLQLDSVTGVISPALTSIPDLTEDKNVDVTFWTTDIDGTSSSPITIQLWIDYIPAT